LTKTSVSCAQCGQVTLPVPSGFMRISPKQVRQLKCIIETMKLLTLMLTLVVFAEAQTVADIARQERERRAHLKNVPVIAAEGVRNATTVSPPPPADSKAPASDKRPPAPAANAPTPALAPAADPVKEWTDRSDKLRKRLQELQDEETALQLQLNQLSNQFFAPVADQNSKDQAQARLGEVTNRLNAVRTELDQTRKTLDTMQLQGPPKQ